MRPSTGATARAIGRLERTDEELAALGGSSIEALFARHHEALYRFCLAFTRHGDEAADIMQTVWERAFVALSRKPGTVEKVRPWLYGVARNACLDTIRARDAERALDAADVQLAGGVCPEQCFEQRAELKLLLDDLAELSERQREALVLRELAGLDGQQLASALGTSPSLAVGLVADARRNLIARRTGRRMPCFTVQDELTRTRGRTRCVQAHLDSCAHCQSFERGRRGRSLSSLAMSPLLFIVGLADRFAGAVPSAPQGVMKASAATALAIGSIGLIQPAVRPAHDRPRTAAVQVSAAKSQRAVSAPGSRRPRAHRAARAVTNSARPVRRSEPPRAQIAARQAAPSPKAAGTAPAPPPAAVAVPVSAAAPAPVAAPAPAPGVPSLAAGVDATVSRTLDTTQQVVSSLDSTIKKTLSLLG